jgi:hypothetical protein
VRFAGMQSSNDNAYVYPFYGWFLESTRTYMHASLASLPMWTHTDSTSGLVCCPEATHVCIVHAPVPPPHTHVPAPPHTLTSPTAHLSCLMYSASAVSSLKRQAWGIRQALRSPSRTPIRMYLSHPMLACRRRLLDTGALMTTAAPVCRTMVHSARTPTTRPLPRPAAIASRHATSRATQVTSALLVSQAAPAALSSLHSPCLSLSRVHASPHARPYTATSIEEGGDCRKQHWKPEWATPL